MRISIASDYRFIATPDGVIWTDGPCHYQHWTRYLTTFSQVNVVARVRTAAEPLTTWRPASGGDVAFSPLPYYLGAWQYLRNLPRVRAAAKRALQPDDAVLLNSPGQISGCVAAALERGRPYGLQVLGNPYEVFAPGVVKHPLRPVLRWWSTRELQRQAHGAAATLYVTRDALQQRYPCPAISYGISDVDLPSEAFRPLDIIGERRPGPIRLISVGSMEQLYKGFDVLLDAVAQVRRQGIALHLTIIGYGRFRDHLEAEAARLGLKDHVDFVGQLPAGSAIRERLDQADLFVLPSRTEGLPRALVEAMARGLPCISTAVGGVPELLPASDLVPPNDVEALATAIARVASDAELRQAMAARNLRTAEHYRAEGLQTQRQEFFKCLAAVTAAWRRSTTNAQTMASESSTAARLLNPETRSRIA